jgi:hypothetical protein
MSNNSKVVVINKERGEKLTIVSLERKKEEINGSTVVKRKENVDNISTNREIEKEMPCTFSPVRLSKNRRYKKLTANLNNTEPLSNMAGRDAMQEAQQY